MSKNIRKDEGLVTDVPQTTNPFSIHSYPDGIGYNPNRPDNEELGYWNGCVYSPEYLRTHSELERNWCNLDRLIDEINNWNN